MEGFLFLFSLLKPHRPSPPLPTCRRWRGPTSPLPTTPLLPTRRRREDLPLPWVPATAASSAPSMRPHRCRDDLPLPCCHHSLEPAACACSLRCPRHPVESRRLPSLGCSREARWPWAKRRQRWRRMRGPRLHRIRGRGQCARWRTAERPPPSPDELEQAQRDAGEDALLRHVCRVTSFQSRWSPVSCWRSPPDKLLVSYPFPACPTTPHFHEVRQFPLI
jgi:hypothetical protein